MQPPQSTGSPAPPVPVVVVLHAGSRPPGMDPVQRVAEVRYAQGAEELARALPGADVLLMWDFASTVLEQAWPAADRVTWIHVAGAGVDRALVPAVVTSDVVVTNARGIFDRAIAEYVAGLVLAMAKDLPRTLDLQRRREWRHRETETVIGRTAVVVGAGPIGRRIAALLRALGLRIRLVGRTDREDDPEFGRIAGADRLAELLPEADYLVLAAPLTPQTRGMVDGAALARLPRGARLINIGRGELVIEDDLVHALRSGRLAGAALDVFAREPLPASSPLWERHDVVVSPHMSADYIGWLDDLAAQFVENFARWRAGSPLHNVVDKHLGYVPTGG